MDKKKRCKKGEVKNPTTELCEPMVEDLKKPKKYSRNKKEDIDMMGEKKKKRKYTRRKEPEPKIENRDELSMAIIQNSSPAPALQAPPAPPEEEEDPDKTISEMAELSAPDAGEEKEDPDKTISEMAELSAPDAAPALQALPEEEKEDPDKTISEMAELSSPDAAKEDPDKTISEMAEPSPQEDAIILVPQNKNDFLLQKEREEYNDDETNPILYPTLNDPNFSYKIAQKQEFADTKYDGETDDIRKKANLLCDSKFELMPHQLFVRNFLSFQTPYNSLLLYHGLGSGKTCSAIGIAEEMRGYMKQMGITKRIIIVASPNVQDNFRLQLFDDRRLEQLSDGTWNLNTCIGNSLLQEINPTNLQGLTRERIISQIKSIIQNYYVFMGNKGEFANYIKKIAAVPEDAGYTKEEAAVIREKKIKAHFNNRLVVLDEIHNIRISDSNKTKATAILLNEVAKKSDNMRLLLLSATPMYNSYNEIIWLVNLLNANDKRGLIKIEDVFNSDGSFVEERRDGIGKVVKEGGKSLLSRKLTGYVSYVRGENPFIFPYRIYPDTFAPDRMIIPSQYPSIQMNQQEIKDPLQFIPVYMNGIGEYQLIGYQFIIQYLGLKSTTLTDKNGKERVMPNFENMESFGYTLLLPPLEALIIVYPNPMLDENIRKKRVNEFEIDEEETKDIIQSILGKQGLSNIMKFSRIEKPIPVRYDYEYIPKMKSKYGEIFLPENLATYSSKIARICEIIRSSTGIVLIYSQYIDGGLVPMALALESMGFSRYASSPDHNRNLFKKPYESIDALTMQKRSQIPKGSNFHAAKYVMITGEKDFSQKNDEDVKYVTSKENANGSKCKVILISMAASEGVDFKNIRQVHILEPWYNMNRVEQIIGRAVRNQSHCDLEFENRNVEIYLHGTKIEGSDEEAADMYVYRSAEKKAVLIGQVTRLMKETAVDCHLNIGQTNFTEAKLLENMANENITLRLSSGKTVPFKVGDKPRTEVCDYMTDCAFTCNVKEGTPPLKDEMVSKTTYHENFVKNNSTIIMKKIRDLFLERTVYKRDHLITAINFVKKYPIEHIYYALTQFINNRHESLIDRYGRTGYMISRGEYYAFQPSEIIDESISTFERSVPVDYKPVSLQLELPKEIKTPVEESMAEVFEDISRERPMNVRSYQTILDELVICMTELIAENVVIKASENNWYKHASKIKSELLTTHEISGNDVIHFVIYHFLDTLPMVDKLELVSNIYEKPADDMNGYETIIKEYFDMLVLEAEEDGTIVKAIVIANGEENRMFVRDESSPVWRPSKYTDESLFAGLRKERLNIKKGKINPTEIGFMHPFKQKEVVFKTKDLTQKRNNKGAKCIDSSKAAVAAKIGAVLGQPDMYATTLIERPELCVLLEVLMRWVSKQNADIGGPIFFFGPEQANEMNLPNYKM